MPPGVGAVIDKSKSLNKQMISIFYNGGEQEPPCGSRILSLGKKSLVDCPYCLLPCFCGISHYFCPVKRNLAVYLCVVLSYPSSFIFPWR